MLIDEALEDWNPWWFSGSVSEDIVGVRRELLSDIEGYIGVPKVKVIVGVRRCGKSTLLYQVIDLLIRRGFASPNDVVLMNFDDARLATESVEEIYKTFLELRKPEKIFLFLDEVHKARDWVSLARRLCDLKGGHVFITDSCSYYIPADYARVLTGRKLEMELYPFSFREFLKLKDVKLQPFGTEQRSILRGYLREYMDYGGFPEVHIYKGAWKRILLEYFDDIITKDVASRFSADYEKVRNLGYYLISNIGQRITNRKIRNIFGLGLETVEKYMNYLEQVYLIFRVRRYSTRVKEQLIAPKKIYAIDTGMANVLGFKVSENLGPILENMVFLSLKRMGYKVFYLQVDDREVDFVVVSNNKAIALINVSYTLQEEKTRKREIENLIHGMKALGVKNAFIVTWDEKETIRIGEKKIEIIPAYEWFLMDKIKR